jgi:hypothetical protein
MMFLVAIAPLLALLVVLIAGRYPGERALDRLRVTLRAGRRGRCRGRRLGPLAEPMPWRGGRLIAVSLAGRAPPVGAGARVQ